MFSSLCCFSWKFRGEGGVFQLCLHHNVAGNTNTKKAENIKQEMLSKAIFRANMIICKWEEGKNLNKHLAQSIVHIQYCGQ